MPLWSRKKPEEPPSPPAPLPEVEKPAELLPGTARRRSSCGSPTPTLEALRAYRYAASAPGVSTPVRPEACASPYG